MDNKVERILTVAVASDLHAYRPTDLKATERLSKLCLLDPENNPTSHPFAGLYELIAKDGLKADILLCPGDMTDRADPDGVKYVWRHLNDAAVQLGASLTAATVGNHDLDSRGRTLAEDPKELLQQLTPLYPLPNEQLNDQYWANHFTVHQTQTYSLVLLNTCSKHTSESELERGYISTHTLNKLGKRLASLTRTPVNILLCHHHPHQHSEYSLGDKDVMKNGQLLIDLLPKHGNWLIIHGHKHFPKLTYAAGGSCSPTVFAAGSFSGNFGPDAETRTRNQFHLIDIVRYNDKPFMLFGKVRSWCWAVGSGWLKAQGGISGMPPNAGFGARTHPAELAKQVAHRMAKSKLKKWEEVCQSIPELDFLIPQDYEIFKGALKNVGFSIEEDMGSPFQIGVANG